MPEQTKTVNKCGREQAKDCSENNKERLQEQARNKYRKLSHEEKDIKWKCGRNRYTHISEEDKKNLMKFKKTIVTSKIILFLCIV